MALSVGKQASHGIPQRRLDALRQREERRFAATHPRSGALFQRARQHMPHGVPLHWMSQWGTPFPVFAVEARKARLTDVNHQVYVDFCLGDSAALFGHANPDVAPVIATEVTGRAAPTCCRPKTRSP